MSIKSQFAINSTKFSITFFCLVPGEHSELDPDEWQKLLQKAKDMANTTFDNATSITAEVMDNYGDDAETECILCMEKLSPATFVPNQKHKLMCIIIERLGKLFFDCILFPNTLSIKGCDYLIHFLVYIYICMYVHNLPQKNWIKWQFLTQYGSVPLLLLFTYLSTPECNIVVSDTLKRVTYHLIAF